MTPVLTHWSYCSLALSHRYSVAGTERVKILETRVICIVEDNSSCKYDKIKIKWWFYRARVIISIIIRHNYYAKLTIAVYEIMAQQNQSFILHFNTRPRVKYRDWWKLNSSCSFTHNEQWPRSETELKCKTSSFSMIHLQDIIGAFTIHSQILAYLIHPWVSEFTPSGPNPWMN